MNSEFIGKKSNFNVCKRGGFALRMRKVSQETAKAEKTAQAAKKSFEKVAAEDAPTPKKRGRPKKTSDVVVETSTDIPKKRGRPKKQSDVEQLSFIAEESSSLESARTKKTGRPKKETTQPQPVQESTLALKKGRGRPKKESQQEQVPATLSESGNVATFHKKGRQKKTESTSLSPVVQSIKEGVEAATPKRRGRPRKTESNSEIVFEIAEGSTPKKRGRKPKANPAATATDIGTEPTVSAKQVDSESTPVKKRGRRKKDSEPASIPENQDVKKEGSSPLPQEPAPAPAPIPEPTPAPESKKILKNEDERFPGFEKRVVSGEKVSVKKIGENGMMVLHFPSASIKDILLSCWYVDGGACCYRVPLNQARVSGILNILPEWESKVRTPPAPEPPVIFESKFVRKKKEEA